MLDVLSPCFLEIHTIYACMCVCMRTQGVCEETEIFFEICFISGKKKRQNLYNVRPETHFFKLWTAKYFAKFVEPTLRGKLMVFLGVLD